MASLSHLAHHWVTSYGYAAIFVLMAISAACIPFPSEVTLLVGGFYSSSGRLDLVAVGLAGTAGSLVGSFVAYVAGRTGGRALLERYGRFVFIRAHDIDRAEEWWERHGDAATFFGRLIPVIRSFISLPAGIAEMPAGKFTLYTLLGVSIWSFGLAFLGDVLGNNWDRASRYMAIPTAIVGALLIGGLAYYYVSKRRRPKATGS
ncbi:MAG: DedA family protein [Actinomycetota bacterium]|nr:DedA family protein [Actinomycetota bacterium]